MVQNLTRASLGHEQMTPFDVAPQIQQQERQRHKEQAQRDRARGGAGAHDVHQAVAGFDTEKGAEQKRSSVKAQHCNLGNLS